MIVLGYMKLGLALWIDWPITLMDESSLDDKRNLEKWDHSNRMSLIIMNCVISKSFKGYKFYDPTLKIIFETRIAQFFEDVEF